MNLKSKNEGELVVQRTELEPLGPSDSQSIWKNFIDGIRVTIGLKPLYLAERWVVAKVRQEEVDADARLLSAKADYEKAAAEARAIELEAEATHAKGMAEARLIERASSKMVTDLIGSRNVDPAAAFDYLASVIQQIEAYGGVIEFELPDTKINDDEFKKDQ